MYRITNKKEDATRIAELERTVRKLTVELDATKKGSAVEKLYHLVR